MGDEDLADGDRGGEQDGVTHISRKRSTYSSRVGGSNDGATTLDRRGRDEEEDEDDDRHDEDRDGQDGAGEIVGRPARRAGEGPLKIGTNGAVSPAATRTSRAISGILKAAL